MLGQFGEKLTIAGPLPPPGRSVALLLNDQLDDASRAQVTSWVHHGGTLVVADPTSPLTGASLAQSGEPDQALASSGPLLPACQAPWVRGVTQVDPAGDPLLEVPAGSEGCFPQAGGDFAVARRLGTGVVVSLGGADLWSNEYLADQDNALLAADLLGPGRGFTVAWLTTPWTAGGNKTIWSLVPARVKACLGGLILAVLAACTWRARRLGRPVLEDPVVPVPGSELVLATGRLLARNRRWDEAATFIRDDLCNQLRSRFGQAPDADPASAALVAAMHTGLQMDEVMATLCGPLPRDEEELLSLAASVHRIRKEVERGTTARRWDMG
jgi:hypothetical protein